MYNRKSVLFKRSLLTVAILSVSACSTTPSIDDYDLSNVGAGILKAGRATAEVSSKAWNKTTYLLGFSDAEDAPVSDDKLLRDQMATAQVQGGTLPDGTVIQPVVIPTVTASEPLLLPDSDTGTVALPDESALAQLEQTQEPELDPEAVLEVEDLIHEVSNSETLWDIAKRTTGDANNWHVLADVNNLAPNAAVYPGQQLVIPADMVKPGYYDPKGAPALAASALEPQNLGDVSSQADDLVDTVDAASNTIAPRILDLADATTTTVVAAKPEEKAPIGGRAFDLNSGETLWDFAKRTTGDATNWQTIAGHNQFSERQAVVVRAGQTIMVPDDLVRPELQAANPVETTASTGTSSAPVITPDISALPAEDQPIASAVEASSELLAEASSLDETQPLADDAQPMKIVEATFKPETPLEPISVEEETPGSQNNASLESIMVSGTYYPKAIYNDPDFSSSLLMRVSPGTTLQVSKSMGNWFQVETNKGLGYVHQRDIK